MIGRSDSDRDLLAALARQAMVDRGFEPDFGPEVAAEVARLAGPAPGPPEARDLRDLRWSSIDNDDSLDLDQLTAVESIGGVTRVWVAIADVHARVDRGTAIDRRARLNSTSLYTPGGVFPMLPDVLSTDLTSLVEGEDRLAVVSEIVVDARGRLEAAGMVRALVRNHARLTYDEVSAWLSGDGPLPPAVARVPGLDADLRLQDTAAALLRRHRADCGALDLERPEARAVFDGGRLVGLRAEPTNRARRLIEDLMIATNEATVRFLENRGWPSLRRVVRAPRRWDRLLEVARAHGESLPERPSAAALQGFLDGRREADPVRFPDLSLTVVKLLGSGEYVARRPGGPASSHFGLAVADYAHSTAPNRRYPDLVTQRLVASALAGTAPAYTMAELGALAAHCTAREDEAKAVERQSLKSAAALLLKSRHGERFEALVTGLNANGTWVRLLDPPVEGKLVRGGAGLDVGDPIVVSIVGTDVARGFIDLVVA